MRIKYLRIIAERAAYKHKASKSETRDRIEFNRCYAIKTYAGLELNVQFSLFLKYFVKKSNE